ncbi:MAG: ROK family transcriptional regulator [Firmicutes bacterium]|nr:ROK family transcriptional regulator [Bacillota bacterium]
MWIGSNSRDLKVLNRLLVRDMIRKLGPIARYEIARETGLTPSTVTVIVAELLQAGVIKEVGHGASSGGRRPILLELNPRAAHVFVIRLQRGELMTAIFDLAKNILAERYCQLDTDDPDQVVEAIGADFEDLVQETQIDLDNILWCGVACPGLVSSHRGVVQRSSNLGWVRVPLSALISKRLGGIPVQVENISNAAALAEKEYGLGHGHKHLVFVNLSVGIGAGIVADGEIYGGVRGYAGELGHMILLAENGPRCACGRQGCFEAVCGARAVIQRARAVIPDEVFLEHGITKEKLTLADLRSSPLADSPEVRALIQETGCFIGVMVANLVSLLNPEMVILGGELSTLGEPLLQAVRSEVEARTLEEIGGNISIQISDMRGSAPLMGAYALALDRIFSLEEWDGHQVQARWQYGVTG